MTAADRYRLGVAALSAVTILAIAAPRSASAQATEVRAAPGNQEMTITFTPSATGVGHDVYLAAEPGVTATNFQTLEGGRAIENVASPITIRGLENNRNYYIAVVERDADGATIPAGEIVGSPRGVWMLVEQTARFVAVSVDSQTPGVAIAAGGGAPQSVGCQATPKPPGCDIYRSIDGGRTWTVASEELVDVDARAVAIHGGVGLVLSRRVGLGDDMLRSGDGGDSWGLVQESALASAVDKTIAFDPTNPDTVFAGNVNFNRGALSQVARSINGGQAFLHVADLVAPNALNARAIAVDPSSSDVVWLGGVGTPRLARSTDGGNNWTPVAITSIGEVQDIVFDPLTPTKIWLADTLQVLESQNGGAVFTPRTNGFEVGTQLRALARDGAGSVLYVGTSTGVYESRDDGRTFFVVGAGLDATVTDIAFSADPAGLIAATPSGMYHLDMIAPTGPIAPELDAGVDAGDTSPGDGGCLCSGSGGPGGATALLLVIAALFVGRGRVFRVAPRSARRFRG